MKSSDRIFKFGVTLAVACALLLSMSSWPSAHGAAGASPKSNVAAALTVTVTIDIGRPRHNCTGFGICRVSITGSTATARRVRGELSTAGDGKLQLTLLDKAPDEGQTLFVDQDVPLSPDIAKKLGLKSATVLRGEYAFSASKSMLNAQLTK